MSSGEHRAVAANNGGTLAEDVEELFDRTGDNFLAFQALARRVKDTWKTVQHNKSALQRIEEAQQRVEEKLDQLLAVVV